MKNRLLKVLFFLVLGLIILFAVFVEYSTSPQFCNSCHIMEPYYNAWKTSTHDFVACVDCHYTPGLQSQARSKFEALNQVVSYVTRTYGSKPRAEINDWSCLRSECHSQRLLQGRVDFMGIHFDHQPHLVEVKRGLRLRCTSCHSQIVQGTHMTVTTSTCFLCHFKNVEIGETIAGCPSCHPPPEATIEVQGVSFNHKEVVDKGITCLKCHVQVVQGGGEVPAERCMICHAEPERFKQVGNVPLIHGTHVYEHKVDCEECHNAIQHGLVKMVSTLEVECSSCHPDQHSEVKELYMGIGGKEVPANPSSMFMTRVGCNGCHLVHREVEGFGNVKVAGEASCIHCHGTEFHGMLGNWKQEISTSLDRMIEIMDTTEKIVSGHSRSDGYVDALRSLETARHNLKVVEMGGGVHNVGYSIELLQSSYESIEESLRNVGSNHRFTPPRLIAAGDQAKQGCSICHIGMRTKKVNVFGLVFDHSIHLEFGLECLRCHEQIAEYSEEGHGSLKLKIDDCEQCHHKGNSYDCSRCHGEFRKNPVDFRGLLFVHENHLAGEGVKCDNCHVGIATRDVRIGRDMDCHSCHHRQEEVACQSCHRTQEMFFRGQGVQGIMTDPNSMVDMVDCRDCHQGIEMEHSVQRIRESCIDCHDEEYGEMVSEWQDGTVETLKDLEELSVEAGRLMESSDETTRQEWQETFNATSELMNRVREDGSKGVHNPLLAEKLLDSAEKGIRTFLENH